jgi:hypothetical protein
MPAEMIRPLEAAGEVQEHAAIASLGKQEFHIPAKAGERCPRFLVVCRCLAYQSQQYVAGTGASLLPAFKPTTLSYL